MSVTFLRLLVKFDQFATRLGSHVEDKLLVSSYKGISFASSSMKHLKGTDTFFNRWLVPLVPIGSLKTCKRSDYDNMFINDTANDRLVEAGIIVSFGPKLHMWPHVYSPCDRLMCRTWGKKGKSSRRTW